MTKKVFFSFHHDLDVWRANQVRNHNVTKEDNAGYLDAAEWEKVEKEGDTAVKNWIDDQLKGTSVTVVLIGAKTSTRPFVKYELKQSWKKGNGILGIHIHNLKNQKGEISTKGDTNFGIIFKNSSEDTGKVFTEKFQTYDWVVDNGFDNFGSWIESAAK